MPPLIPFLAFLLILLFHASAHRCVLRDTPNQPSTTLPDSIINDDYCHCLDGSDEYRTSACPNGIFICANTAYRKKSIPTSWVQDGSCDCCDGSDELAGRCPDNCAALRENNMKEAKQRAGTVMRGVATRQTYVKDASGAIEKDERELRKLKRELAAIERALGKSKARADGLRKRRDWQPRPPVVEKSNPVSDSKQEPPTSAGRHVDHDDDEYDYEEHIKEDENSEEPSGKDSDPDTQKNYDDPDDVHEEDEEDDDDFDDDDDDDDYDDDEDDDDNEELARDIDEDEDEPITSPSTTEKEGETKQEDDTGTDSDEDSQTSISASETNEPEVTLEASLNVDSICAELESSGFNYIFRFAAYARAIVLAKLHRLLPKIFPVRPDSAISGLDQCIRQADSAKWKFQSQKQDIEEKIKKLKKKQTTNYGTDMALRKLHGECTKTKVMQYEFEHCAFDLVRQYEHGSAIATLGRFEGWEVDGNDRYMKYTGGDGCWNGPARSVKVELSCGEEEEIVSVDEPNRCTYFMKFRTPAVCEQEMADEIMSAFDTDSEQKEEL